MVRMIHCAGAGVVVVLLAAATAWGQYATGGNGRLLDANRRIGSGGVNERVSPVDTRLNTGNLMMTGNVTGGRSFKGTVGYSSPYEIQVATGTGTLDTFRRDSVGSRHLGTGIVQPGFFVGGAASVERSYGSNVVQYRRDRRSGVCAAGSVRCGQ